jgi:Domain of unknown function (DUF2760)
MQQGYAMNYDQIILTAIITGAVTAAVTAAVCWFVFPRGRLDPPVREVVDRMQRDADFATKVRALLEPPPPPKPSGAPLRLLALLQREGRLLDFLLEDIEAYANEQIGAAVRDIHRNCRKAIQEHLVLEPVLAGEEQSTVEVATGFDPSAIRLTGNVTGQPPFRGTLLHHGWRVKEIKLARPAEGLDEFIVQPAEVELP